MTFRIPKILHQIWIGPKTAPTNLMRSWKEKHPDFEYIYWNEDEIAKREMTFECQPQIDAIKEINGKADIMRWEILYKYGGVFVDADSICIEPFDAYFMQKNAFATYENETERKGLVATGTMGFIPQYSMCRDIIDKLKTGQLDEKISNFRAWYSVGPALLTDMLNTGKYNNFSVFPSYCFLPVHFTGPTYEGHCKVYGYQEWGTAKNSYDTMNQIVLPSEFEPPTNWVSVLMPCYNTPELYITECLNSIKNQIGYFGIELVCVDDGSTTQNSDILVKCLNEFKDRTRFTKIIYERILKNRGVAFALNLGLSKCTNEMIIRMDSDDIMTPMRIKTQLEFMEKYPECVVCGGSMEIFENPNPKNLREKRHITTSIHPLKYTWSEFKEKPRSWLLNHPTLCFRKSAILDIGKYNENREYTSIMEDFELELRLLKQFGEIYSLPSNLLYYRIHHDQLTWNSQPDPIILNNIIKTVESTSTHMYYRI